MCTYIIIVVIIIIIIIIMMMIISISRIRLDFIKHLKNTFRCCHDITVAAFIIICHRSTGHPNICVMLNARILNCVEWKA